MSNYRPDLPHMSKMTGHALVGQGAPVYLNDQGRFLGFIEHTNEGPAMCECNAISPVLHSNRKRQLWHREHKNELYAAGHR